MWALGGDGAWGGGIPQGEDGLGRKCVIRKKTRLGKACGSKVKMGSGMVPHGKDGVREKMGLRDDLDLVVG